jgi:hypothetical protein
MTEEERLRRGGWGRMYRFIKSQKSKRKRMLALCACCRVTWEHAKLACNREAIEACERYADGQVRLAELRRCVGRMRFEPVVYTSWFLDAAGPASREGRGFRSPQTDDDMATLDEFRAVERASDAAWVACGLDVFGNVFRKAKVRPAWVTDTVLTLARQMYDSRDFGAMPILADALQDAGCNSEDILSHCRDTNQVHVRGCWVVDLVLGKH